MLVRKIVIIIALGLLLCACKNPEAPSLVDLGFMPDDQTELRNSPEYVDLSKYEIEEPEEEYVPIISPKESEIPTVFIKYDQPINGYNVTVDLHPEDDAFYGPAELHFSKGNSGFIVHVDNFEEDHFNWETVLHDGETITLKHTPLPKGKMLSEKCTFFFSDEDYDGTKELLVREPLAGTRGTNLYHVYELDGTEREDEPFYAIRDMTHFDASEKSITQEEYYGIILGSDFLKYRRQKDGSFALTDSTHLDYKVDFSDSIRALCAVKSGLKHTKTATKLRLVHKNKNQAPL